MVSVISPDSIYCCMLLFLDHILYCIELTLLLAIISFFRANRFWYFMQIVSLCSILSSSVTTWVTLNGILLILSTLGKSFSRHGINLHECQILVSGKLKKNVINLSSAELAQRGLKVKFWGVSADLLTCSLMEIYMYFKSHNWYPKLFIWCFLAYYETQKCQSQQQPRWLTWNVKSYFLR